jgi:hypothetical protein
MTKRLSDEELAELERLASVPQNSQRWTFDPRKHVAQSDDSTVFFIRPEHELDDKDAESMECGGDIPGTNAFACALLDAEYTIAIRSAAPSLLAEVRELREERKKNVRRIQELHEIIKSHAKTIIASKDEGDRLRAAVSTEARINVAQLDELYELRAFKTQVERVVECVACDGFGVVMKSGEPGHVCAKCGGAVVGGSQRSGKMAALNTHMMLVELEGRISTADAKHPRDLQDKDNEFGSLSFYKKKLDGQRDYLLRSQNWCDALFCEVYEAMVELARGNLPRLREELRDIATLCTRWDRAIGERGAAT